MKKILIKTNKEKKNEKIKTDRIQFIFRPDLNELDVWLEAIQLVDDPDREGGTKAVCKPGAVALCLNMGFDVEIVDLDRHPNEENEVDEFLTKVENLESVEAVHNFVI